MIIDGLDKAAPKTRDKILNFLSILESERLEHLHVLVSSRALSKFSGPFTSSGWLTTNVDHQIKDDIRNYVLTNLEDNHELRRFSGVVKQRIVDQILLKCKSTRYVIS